VGADFAALARAHSDGHTKEQGGNWDWTECESLACEELGSFLSTGKIGSTSEVIAHEDEYHIAKIHDRDEAPTRSFAEVEPELREGLKQAGRQLRFRRAMRKFIDQSEVQTVFGNNRELKDQVLEHMLVCPIVIYGPAGVTISPPRWNPEGAR
jgi:parvulin-like peptidyl-prolyl isomerase